MKLALFLVASLAACKPSSSAKPAEGSAAAPVVVDHARGAAPALPAVVQAGSADSDDQPEAKKSPLDTNGDGVVSPEEREAAKAARAKRFHDRFDANHDGKLTPDELAAAGAGHFGPHFDDPNALDTNNDGEISPDELQAGMRELRVQRHNQWMNGSGQ